MTRRINTILEVERHNSLLFCDVVAVQLVPKESLTQHPHNIIFLEF